MCINIPGITKNNLITFTKKQNSKLWLESQCLQSWPTKYGSHLFSFLNILWCLRSKVLYSGTASFLYLKCQRRRPLEYTVFTNTLEGLPQSASHSPMTHLLYPWINPLAPKTQRRLKNWIKWRHLAKGKSRNVYGQNNVRAVVPGCVDIAYLLNTGQSESSTRII